MVFLFGVLGLLSANLFAQQREYYIKARDAYLKAATNTKCPERARVFKEYADWNQCMADVLAGTKTNCPASPTTPIPPCEGDMMGSNGSSATGAPSGSSSTNQNTDDLANSVKEIADGVSELAKMKLEDNATANDWFMISGGANLQGDAGPIAGTTADIGKLSGGYFSAQALSRKGMSFMSSYTALNSDYFHSFRAKDEDGDLNNYIGTTKIQTSVLDLSLGKDYTGTAGTFHFVPNIGADLIFEIKNNFIAKNFQGVEYEETWNDKGLFFALHGGVQMFYLFGKRIGVQGGGKYIYFPSETKGSVFKTNNFFHLNAGISIRLG